MSGPNMAPYRSFITAVWSGNDGPGRTTDTRRGNSQ